MYQKFCKLISAFFVLIVVCGLSVEAGAKQEFQPAVLYDMATKHDKSFNEGVYNGLKKYKEDTGVDFWEFQITNETQSEQFLRQMAKKGANIIVVVGFAQIPALQKVAPEFPETQFTLIDAELDLPNVQSVVFREHEGSYLVGALAALKSKTRKIGFIGGMDIPLIHKWSCGYEQGAKALDPTIEIVVNWVGDTPMAWKDPTKAREIAVSQMDRGVDIIYTGAGTSGIGVLGAVADRENVLAIGTDSNQNYMYPGKILTSMVKRVDLAAYDALKASQNGNWKPGVKVLGLKENGVDWSLDEFNSPLISDEIKEKINALKKQIIDGKINVVDPTKVGSCSY